MCERGTYKKVHLAFPHERSVRMEADVDACIAPIVQALNDAGFRTLASCCGHGFANPFILLEQNGQTLELLLPRKRTAAHDSDE